MCLIISSTYVDGKLAMAKTIRVVFDNSEQALQALRRVVESINNPDMVKVDKIIITGSSVLYLVVNTNS